MTSWYGMSPEEIERGYNNRAAVPDHPQWFARWGELSARAFATEHVLRDLRFGPGPKETLDLFLPRGAARGTFLFLHGGWWRSLDKDVHALVAPPLTAQGIAVAVANYDLCPQVTIADIVEEASRAVAWIAREGPKHGTPARPLVVGGHSAGGQLAAMMLARDWTREGFGAHPVAGAVSLSGVHDLRPLVHFSANVDLNLDDAEAARLSPVQLAPACDAPIVIAVGGRETGEFLRQADLLWEAWPRNRPRGMPGPLVIPDRHHFDVVVDHAEAGSALTRATLALFDGRRAV
ncbi:MAG: alpha/beta hydrolase [Burkholderiales bacterium]|nr:alpha/beta hydrolase [Burkholderiales bacterium]MCE7876266.1 alpha/beta hydrolase [Betaproteobacteria bacterium PRO3]